jgi:site-specific recombinase XerC
LGFLRGVCAAIASSTPIEDLVAAFARHLRERQGLASPTIERYTIVARQFLENRFNAGEIDMRAVVATDIIDFIYRQVAHLRPSGLKCVVTAMRSFLRYGQYLGDVAGELVAAVPAVATGATTPALPRAISREHAQRAIDSCDVGTGRAARSGHPLASGAAWTAGQRSHHAATRRLRLRLGTRDVRVRSKGGRQCLLPMPDDVGAPLPRILSAAGQSATIATCSCVRRHRSAASCMAQTPSARS